MNANNNTLAIMSSLAGLNETRTQLTSDLVRAEQGVLFGTTWWTDRCDELLYVLRQINRLEAQLEEGTGEGEEAVATGEGEEAVATGEGEGEATEEAVATGEKAVATETTEETLSTLYDEREALIQAIDDLSGKRGRKAEKDALQARLEAVMRRVSVLERPVG